MLLQRKKTTKNIILGVGVGGGGGQLFAEFRYPRGFLEPNSRKAMD